MRAPVVVEVDPVPDQAAGVLQGLEAVAMHALLLELADDPLDQAVLLRAMRRDELLAQPVAPDQGGEAAAGEHQAVIRAQQEWLGNPAQRAEAGDQRLLQGRLGRLGSTAARQVSAQQFAAVAVDHQRQRRQAIAPGPHPAHIRRPALVGRLRHRGQRLDPGPEAHRALAQLPTPELEDALHRVLVEAQQVRHCPVPEGWVLFNHGLDRGHEALLQRRAGFDWPVVHRAPGHLKPLAQLADRDGDAVGLQSLADRLDHFSSSPNRDCNFFLARSSSIASP